MRYEEVVIFASGVAIGVFCSWRYFKDKYEKIANDEIESVKRSFGKNTVKKEEKTEEKSGLYRDKLPETLYEKVNTHLESYDTVSKDNPLVTKMAENEAPSEATAPYIITEDQYADIEPFFDKITLRYQVENGELYDDMSDKYIDPESTIGSKNLGIFAASRESVMYVRDEGTSIDYEVIKL